MSLLKTHPQVRFVRGCLSWLGCGLLLAGVYCMPKGEPPSALQLAQAGTVCVKLGRWNAGRTLLDRALAQNGQLYQAHYGLGLLCYAQQRFEMAEREARLAMQAPAAKDEAWLLLAQALQGQGKTTEALAVYEALLGRSQEAYPRYVIGIFCLKMGRLSEARLYLEAYLKLAPAGQEKGAARAALDMVKGKQS